MANITLSPESLDGFYRRTDQWDKGYRELAFIKRRGLQNAELNDWIYLTGLNNRAMFEGIYADGDILKKGGITYAQGAAQLGPFTIISDGFAVNVAAQLIGVPATGTQILGIAVQTKYITELEDPDLLDPAIGTDNANKAGAARRQMTGKWVLSTDDPEPGTKFYPLYTFIAGELYTPDIIDPVQSKINDTLARSDFSANGSYVSRGTRVVFNDKVTRTNPDSSTYEAYNFFLESGTFNVQGYQYVFSSNRSFDIPDMTDKALRQNEPVQFFTPRKKTVLITVNSGAPTAVVTLYTITIGTKIYQFNTDATPTTTEIILGLLAQVNGDAQALVVATAQSSNTQLLLTGKTFDDFPSPLVSGFLTSNVTQTAVSDYYETDFADVDAVTQITGPRQIVGEVVTHGPAGSADLLTQNPVVSIDSIAGYTQGTDYILTGNSVDWSPGGAEPSSGSTYTVTYTIQYTINNPTGIISSDKTRIQLSGFKNNSSVLVTYTNWLKRRDVVMLGLKGTIYLVPGIPGYVNPPAKSVVSSLDLPVAEVLITKFDDPEIEFVYPPAFTMKQVQEIQQKVEELQYNLARSSLQDSVNRQDPLNNKVNMFVDPLLNNDLRDEGLTNTAVVYASAIHLAVTPYIHNLRVSPKTVTMPYTHELYRSQPAYSKARRINEFLNLIMPKSAVASVLPTQQRYVAKVETLTPIESIQQVTSSSGAGVVTSPTSQPVTSTTDISRQDWDREVLNSRAPSTSVKVSGKGFLSTESVKIYYNNILVTTTTTDNSGALVDFPVTLPSGVGIPGSNELVIVSVESNLQVSVDFEVIPQQRLDINPQRSVITITPPPVVNRTNTNNLFDRGSSGAGIGSAARGDPLAQTYYPDRDIYFTKVEVVFEELPKTPVTMMYTPSTDSGVPDGGKIKTSASKIPTEITAKVKTTFEPSSPAFTEAQTEHGFILLNQDSDAQVRVAELGAVNLVDNTRITSNPFLEGVLLNSSNQSSWTTLQSEDMQFWLYRAKFDTTQTYEVELGTVDLSAIGQLNVTDLMVMTGVRTHATTSVQIKVELLDRLVSGSPETHIVDPYKNITIAAYSGSVRVKATMSTQDEFLTPEIDSTVALMLGKVASSGIYTSRAFDVSGDLIRVFVECFEPASGSVAVSLQQGTSFTTLTRDSGYAVLKDNGFTEYRYSINTFLPGLNQTRLRIQVNGVDPTRRPMARAPRVYVADTTP